MACPGDRIHCLAIGIYAVAVDELKIGQTLGACKGEIYAVGRKGVALSVSQEETQLRDPRSAVRQLELSDMQEI